jgi:hypothetical protein
MRPMISTAAAIAIILLSVCPTLAVDCVDYALYDFLVGYVDTPGTAMDVAVAGNHAYVADGYSLQVIDVSSSEEPALVGQIALSVWANSVVVEGCLAYVASTHGGLMIIDVTDPNHPVLVGAVEVPAASLDIAVAGGLAFLANQNYGLKVIDVSDPAQPHIVGSLQIGSVGVDAIPGYVFVGCGSNGFKVVDVADPAHPVVVGTCAAPPGSVGSVTYHEGMVYLGCGVRDQGALWAIDVSNPHDPTPLADLPLPDPGQGSAVSGEHLFIGCRTDGLIAIDISDPSAPVMVGSYPGHALGVAAAGDHAYYVSCSLGLTVVDISNPVSPTLAATGTDGYALAIAAGGSIAAVADGFRGLKILDLDDPEMPIIGQVPTLDDARDVFIREPHVFVAGGAGGLEVYDVSDPASPSLAGQANTPYFAYCVQVQNDLALVGSCRIETQDGSWFWYWGAVSFFDISDPSHPTELAIVASEDWFPNDIQIKGSLAYVADNTDIGRPSFFRIIDFTDPQAPVVTGSLTLPNEQTPALALAGDRVFLGCDTTRRLRVVNVMDPVHPILETTVPIPGRILSLAIAGDLLYAGDDRGNVRVVDVSVPVDPEPVGLVHVFARTCGLDVVMDRVLTASWDQGVWAIPVHCSSAVPVIDHAPSAFIGLRSFPNPFNPRTTMNFALPVAGQVQVAIYDAKGRMVARLVNESLPAGAHDVAWDGRDAFGAAMPSGTYFCRLTTSGGVEARKLQLVR